MNNDFDYFVSAPKKKALLKRLMSEDISVDRHDDPSTFQTLESMARNTNLVDKISSLDNLYTYKFNDDFGESKHWRSIATVTSL